MRDIWRKHGRKRKEDCGARDKQLKEHSKVAAVIKMRWWTVLIFCLLVPLLADLCSAFSEGKGCNRTVRNSVGWIRWTGRMGRCVVRIRAPLRDPQVIEVRVRRSQVGILRDAKCNGAYVQFSDGIEDLEDDVGRYCGHVVGNATRLFLRRGPELTIVMDSDTSFATENPVIFSAQFSVLPARLAMERHRAPLPSAAECSLECSERNNKRKCRITSPGYPGVYPRGLTCRISLESSSGRFRIGGLADDTFNLMNYTIQDGCRTENCEEHVEGDIDVSPMNSEMSDASSDHRRIRSSKQSPFSRKSRSFNYEFEEDAEMIIGADVRQRRLSRKNDQEQRIWSNNRKKRRKLTRDRDLASRKRFRDSSRNRDQGSQPKRHAHKKFRSSLNERNPNLHSDGLETVDEIPERIGDKPQESLFDQKFTRRKSYHETANCVSDYLAVYENLDGEIVEISKFCGVGHFPEMVSRGKNVIVEFFSERDGTILHDGFQLTLNEVLSDAIIQENNCEFLYRSSDKNRESIKSFQSWYSPNTLCSYKFLGKNSEKVYVQLKIVRNALEEDFGAVRRRNSSSNYCPGNEITIYNGAFSNGSVAWSFCDVFHSDINNIQVPVTSMGNALLVQYFSAKGSLSGKEFTYEISYKFVRKAQNGPKKKSANETRVISLKPVNFTALNLTGNDNCNCDFSSRLGTFKSWFMVLVVLGVISFLGAVFTIVALLTKCLKTKAIENKLLQTPKR